MGVLDIALSGVFGRVWVVQSTGRARSLRLGFVEKDFFGRCWSGILHQEAVKCIDGCRGLNSAKSVCTISVCLLLGVVEYLRCLPRVRFHRDLRRGAIEQDGHFRFPLFTSIETPK